MNQRIAAASAPRFAPTPLCRSLHLAFAALAAAAMVGAVRANPLGGNVVAGQASIVQPSPALMQINQSSQRAVIDWRSFSIGVGEAVQFNQPSASAATLNRVIGNDPSSILGSLSANGRVYLVNQNGVFIGRDAQVDAAALVLSTANISNSDFMAGRLNFNQPGKPGARIVNEGRISAADGGLVAMVAPGVENRGVISARLGQVILAGAPAFSLDLFGDGLVNIVLNQAGLGTIADATGKPLANYVDNGGRVLAEGGRIWISAATARGLVDGMVNISGELRATRVAQQGGQITLLGGNELNVSGSVIATGSQQGGSIAASADKIMLGGTSVLDASGVGGGGSVLIGGGFQGKAPVPGASSTAGSLSVAGGASIRADATGSTGNGGLVVLWSENDTHFAGAVSARGGAAGGDGGLMEVSGKKQLAFEGQANASAPMGNAGTLLLDPGSLIVASAGSGPFTATGINSVVAASTVDSVLRTGTTVSLKADDNLLIASAIDGRPVAGNLFGAAGGGLNLQAGGAVAVNASIVLNNGAFNSTSGSFSQLAGNAISTQGDKPISISTAGDLSTQYLLTQGGVSLNSTGGNVTASQPLGGTFAGTPQPLASLQVAAPAGTASLMRGIQVTGDANASAGQVLLGQALVGGTLNIAASSGLTISGNVQAGGFLAGQGVPLGSFSMIGPTADATPRIVAGAGGVSISAQSFGALGGIRSDAAVELSAASGNVALAGVEAVGAGSIDIKSGGSISVATGSTVLSRGGRVQLTASGGNISAEGTIAANDPTSSVEQPVGVVQLSAKQGDVSVRQLAASGTIAIDAGGSVNLIESIGGDSKEAPLIGSLSINAGGNVVTHGLNLAGTTTQGANGLVIQAGGGIDVWDRIGVTRGNLLFGTTPPSTNEARRAMLYQGVYARNAQDITFNVPVVVNGSKIAADWQQITTEFQQSGTGAGRFTDMVLIPTSLNNTFAERLVRNGGGLFVTATPDSVITSVCSKNAAACTHNSDTSYWMVPKIVISNQETPRAGDVGQISLLGGIKVAPNPDTGTASAAIKVIVPMHESEVSDFGAYFAYRQRTYFPIDAGSGWGLSDPNANLDNPPTPLVDPPYSFYRSRSFLPLPFNLVVDASSAAGNNADFSQFAVFGYTVPTSSINSDTSNIRSTVVHNGLYLDGRGSTLDLPTLPVPISFTAFPGPLADGKASGITDTNHVGVLTNLTEYRSNSTPSNFLPVGVTGVGGLNLSQQIAAQFQGSDGTTAVYNNVGQLETLAELRDEESNCKGTERQVVGRTPGDEADVGLTTALRGVSPSVFNTSYSLGQVSEQYTSADARTISGQSKNKKDACS